MASSDGKKDAPLVIRKISQEQIKGEREEFHLQILHHQVHQVRSVMETAQAGCVRTGSIRLTGEEEIRELRKHLRRLSQLLKVQQVTRDERRTIVMEFFHAVEQLCHKCLQAAQNSQFDLFLELELTLQDLPESFRSLENNPYPFSNKYLRDLEISCGVSRDLLKKR